MPEVSAPQALETVTPTTRIHVDDPFAAVKLANDLGACLQNVDGAGARPKVLLCIGTDRSTGDSLGPLVGSRMERLDQDLFIVRGTLADPVHATNLADTLTAIEREYGNPLIIAVDACLGYLENVGCVTVGEGSLKPGAGVKKSLPPVGDLHITGVVNVGGFMEYLVLQNTRLNLVMRLADLIVDGLALMAGKHRRFSCQAHPF
ncbi:MAG: spore protease YyaC [Thermoanaerobacterales bacterium]|nr:spore protease YyaC [Bacillota bacterium]MDI6907738.1 spore protease YyaC [Thermoanaerobacterales bacterium]